MSLSRYNRIFNLSLAIVVIYNILFFADVIFDFAALDSIIDKTAVIYLIFAFGMLVYKIYLAFKNFIGSKDTIVNIIVHMVLAITSLIFAIILL